jgi:single-strand DNA-binding protein
MNINKAMIYGNLTRDPEMRALPSGGSVCSFSIATNRVYKKADGTRAEEVSYHNVVVFGRQAETSAQYLKKGSSAYVEGRLQTRSWDKDGQKQYRTEIVADTVQFGPRPSGASGGGASGSSQSAGSSEFEGGMSDAEAPQKAPKDDAIDYPAEDINPDDIPF